MDYRGDLTVLKGLSDYRTRTAIVVMGGGMSCVVSLGVLVALVVARLTKFRRAVGVSGGACNIAGLMSGNIDQVFGVFEHLARTGCITMRWTNWWGWQMSFDRDKLMRILSEMLDVEAIKNDPRRFFTVATRVDGSGKFLDGNAHPLDAIRATVSIQGACDPVTIDGEVLGDGMPGFKIPDAMRKVRAKQVIFVTNRYPVEQRWWFEQLITPHLYRLALASETQAVRQAAIDTDMVFEKHVDRIVCCKRIRALHIFPGAGDPDLTSSTSDVAQLKIGFNRAREGALRLIDKALAA